MGPHLTSWRIYLGVVIEDYNEFLCKMGVCISRCNEEALVGGGR